MDELISKEEMLQDAVKHIYIGPPFGPPDAGPCVCIPGKPTQCGNCGDPPPTEVPVGGTLPLALLGVGVMLVVRRFLGR